MQPGGQEPREQARREDDILLACAMRFDARTYLADTAYDPEPLLAAFAATGDWPEDAEALHLFAAYHVLQRRLMAWGERPVPRDGRLWYVLRSLFLEVAPLPVPPRYRHALGWARWQERYGSRCAAIVAAIRDVHEHTAYHEDALGPC